MNNKSLRIIATFAILLALFVVMLGAYTRLTHAGLGCPDWPGCYGRLVLPSADNELGQAQLNYPQIPIESRKAWTEMAHRYVAGILGLIIFSLGFWVIIRCWQKKNVLSLIPIFLMILVIFQAALGMWTVTLKLLPVVVMGHLLGGIFIFSSLCYFRLQLSEIPQTYLPKARFCVGLGVILVVLQIALGGWVSSNYAGVACLGFPQCNGFWIPTLHFSQGFNLFSPVGANYQGGLLDNDIRATIQFVHRVGAVLVAGYVLCLSTWLLCSVNYKYVRRFAILAASLVLAQFTLGILNVLYFLPISIAVLHNGVAALLLAAMVGLFYVSKGK